MAPSPSTWGTGSTIDAYLEKEEAEFARLREEAVESTRGFMPSSMPRSGKAQATARESYAASSTPTETRLPRALQGGLERLGSGIVLWVQHSPYSGFARPQAPGQISIVDPLFPHGHDTIMRLVNAPKMEYTKLIAQSAYNY